MDPFRNLIQGAAPQHRTYQECFLENGRYYGTFKMGKYLLPLDESECERMDVFHKIFLVARKDVLYSAPLNNKENPKTLDLGCGTGIWGIDMAERCPNGYHVGIDLNLIQPEFIPANMKFMQKDMEDEWEHLDPGSWDLIHMRALNGSITNWPGVYAEIYRHLKPQCYFEQVEVDWYPRCDDGTLPRNSYFLQWANELMDAMNAAGRPMRVDGSLTKQRLAEAGFDDIKEEVIQLPINGWPADAHSRDVGRWFNLGARLAYEPLALAVLSRPRARTPTEIHQLSERVTVEVHSNSVHAYCTLHIFTARKPRAVNHAALITPSPMSPRPPRTRPHQA